MVKKFRYGFQDSCPPPPHSRLTSPREHSARHAPCFGRFHSQKTINNCFLLRYPLCALRYPSVFSCMVKKFRYGFQDSCPPPSHSRLTSPQILGSSRSLLWAVSLAKNNNQLFFASLPVMNRFDIPPYLIVKYHYTARVFCGRLYTA